MFCHYNGLAAVKNGGLGTSLEVEKAKQPGFNRLRDNDLMLLSKVLNKLKVSKRRITKGMVYKVKPVAQG